MSEAVAIVGNVRPHPNPLPRGEGTGDGRFGFGEARPAMAVSRVPRSCENFSLSSGERAGVRASVSTYLFRFVSRTQAENFNWANSLRRKHGELQSIISPT